MSSIGLGSSTRGTNVPGRVCRAGLALTVLGLVILEGWGVLPSLPAVSATVGDSRGTCSHFSCLPVSNDRRWEQGRGWLLGSAER